MLRDERIDFSFNPHRPVKAGAFAAEEVVEIIRNTFQSSPAVKAGALGGMRFREHRHDEVSILTGPLRPVLSGYGHTSR